MNAIIKLRDVKYKLYNCYILSFEISENSGRIAEEDSSDSMSSSDDTYSFSSDDEAEYVKPVIPQRPCIPLHPKDIPGTSSEAKHEAKKDDSGIVDSGHASEDQVHSNSGKTDAIAPKCEVVSEELGANSRNCDQSSEKTRDVEPGNTLNNFLEICTKSSPNESILPEEINEEVSVPGGPQSTDIKISTKESTDTDKESSSSKESDMGETKYKEITEEPEEELAKSENTSCENTDCGTVSSESTTAVIPGLQEIQEGRINDQDVIDSQDDDVRMNNDVSLKNEKIIEENLEEAPAATDTVTSSENDVTELQDGLAVGDPEISAKNDTILPQETKDNSSEDLPQEGTHVRTESEGNAVTQELPSTDKDIAADEDLDTN
jgi:hypothetical protein